MNKLEIKTLEELEKDLMAERLEQQENLYHVFPEAGKPFWDINLKEEEHYSLG